jgi:hypothetical protein
MALCNEMQVNVQTLSSIETLHDRLVELNHGKTESESGPSVEEFLQLSSQEMANTDDAASATVAVQCRSNHRHGEDGVGRSCPFQDLNVNDCMLGHFENYEK